MGINFPMFLDLQGTWGPISNMNLLILLFLSF
jgi:hypothetical protein